eukprot:970930-Rhodomonas_salina.3
MVLSALRTADCGQVLSACACYAMPGTDRAYGATRKSGRVVLDHGGEMTQHHQRCSIPTSNKHLIFNKIDSHATNQTHT